MGKLLTSHRSTIYPCFLPNLGDSIGAGRIRLTRGKSNNNLIIEANDLLKSFILVALKFLYLFSNIKNNQMENQTSVFKGALNYGTILGLVLIVVSLITFLIGDYESKIMQYVSWVIIIAGLAWSIKSFRDKDRGGVLSYGGVLGIGTMTSVVFGILTCVFTYIYLKFVDDSMILFIWEQTEMEMSQNREMTREQMETAMTYSKMFTSAGAISIFAFLANVIMGFIISLILGIFMKKEETSFN